MTKRRADTCRVRCARACCSVGVRARPLLDFAALRHLGRRRLERVRVRLRDSRVPRNNPLRVHHEEPPQRQLGTHQHQKARYVFNESVLQARPEQPPIRYEVSHRAQKERRAHLRQELQVRVYELVVRIHRLLAHEREEAAVDLRLDAIELRKKGMLDHITQHLDQKHHRNCAHEERHPLVRDDTVVVLERASAVRLGEHPQQSHELVKSLHGIADGDWKELPLVVVLENE
mmetsp:Transcript_12892/g.54154  ORF Transcript_12892/g.54154 Transcript_12892/m.54154 type:complete len:231 (-) Transcript_12892:1134-1826(-)